MEIELRCISAWPMRSSSCLHRPVSISHCRGANTSRFPLKARMDGIIPHRAQGWLGLSAAQPYSLGTTLYPKPYTPVWLNTGLCRTLGDMTTGACA